MRKLSAMGSSRFEFDINGLDRRKAIREDAYASAYGEVLATIEQMLTKYVDGDIVTRQSLEEWLGQELTKEFIRRR